MTTTRARCWPALASMTPRKDSTSYSGCLPSTVTLRRTLSRWRVVACLRATGCLVYAINPMAAARYRERHTVSRKKFHHLDAMVLAHIIRTDATAHRQLPVDSELAQAVASSPALRRTRSGTAAATS
ncbi:IS110 family transposase [Streptomyces chartreusis]|uniref:IS110 family transposase n=1 Tax=Streptomyces chartreusis TaxID=1969 RepID=UPI002E199BED|nr:transposase [Streptomyces chartreusis]